MYWWVVFGNKWDVQSPGHVSLAILMPSQVFFPATVDLQNLTVLASSNSLSHHSGHVFRMLAWAAPEAEWRFSGFEARWWPARRSWFWGHAQPYGGPTNV